MKKVSEHGDCNVPYDEYKKRNCGRYISAAPGVFKTSEDLTEDVRIEQMIQYERINGNTDLLCTI